MSNFTGFEGMDLSGVEVSDRRVLGPGRHVVKITEAKVTADKNKGLHQLEVAYSNDDGGIRNWLTLNYPSSPEATRIGLEQLKALLLCLGHEGDKTPPVEWFRGRTVGINVKSEMYNGKEQLKVNYHWSPSEQMSESGAATGHIEDKIPWN